MRELFLLFDQIAQLFCSWSPFSFAPTWHTTADRIFTHPYLRPAFCAIGDKERNLSEFPSIVRRVTDFLRKTGKTLYWLRECLEKNPEGYFRDEEGIYVFSSSKKKVSLRITGSAAKIQALFPFQVIEDLTLRGDGAAFFPCMRRSANELASLRFLKVTSEERSYSKPSPTVPAEIGKCRNLETLVLKLNRLQSLPSDLAHLQNLRKLDLSLNRLTFLPDIANLVRLEELNLSWNRLSSLPETIGSLVELRILYLQHNALRILPQGLGGLSNLRRLDLSNNRLQSLLDSIGSLSELITLNASENELTRLPDSLNELSKLRDLDLHKNRLRSLSASFGGLKSLRDVDLGENMLLNLPLKWDNRNLHVLDLRNNELTHLPKKLFPEPNDSMRTLDLSRNRLTSLPPCLGNCVSLRNLYLENNELVSLPEEIFPDDAPLKRLNVSCNCLRSFPNSIAKLEYLKSLQARANRIRALPSPKLRLFGVTMIDLSYNEISQIPDYLWCMPSLKFFILRGNLITSIALQEGDFPSKIQQLDLDDNLLQSLPESCRLLANVRTLRLEGNQWKRFPAVLTQLRNLSALYMHQDTPIRLSREEQNFVASLRYADVPQPSLLGRVSLGLFAMGVWIGKVVQSIFASCFSCLGGLLHMMRV
ncbi:MAG: leucine-rich repeat domain-containing protein [Chlamydiota bacterium]